MPKLSTFPGFYTQTEDKAFLSELDSITNRCANRTKRNNKAKENDASPEYWKRQRENLKADCGSWDHITDLLAEPSTLTGCLAF